MAWPSIVATAGTITFTELRGGLTPQAERVDPIERPGIDGIAFIKSGKKAPPSRLVGFVTQTTTANFKTLLDALAALRGEKVTVNLTRLDGTVEAHTNVIIEGTRELRSFAIGKSSGGPVANPKLGTEWEILCRETEV